MPIRYLDLQPQIQQYGHSAGDWQRSLQEQLKVSLECFNTVAQDVTALNQSIQKVINQQGKNIRFALPGQEKITSSFSAGEIKAKCTLLAADGSQINPDPHESVLFGLLNVGIFKCNPGISSTPVEIVNTKLLDFDEVYSTENILDEDTIALKRNLAERELLAELAAQIQGEVVALTDGPLELFHAPREGRAFQAQFNNYLQSLRKMGESGAITGGYVDKPRADLVIRMLELAMISDPSRAGQDRPLAGITDSQLFNEILEPGTRSAIFGIQSSSKKYYEGPLALHFFYLNVGQASHPWIARIEIPAWVAQDSVQVAHLQAILLDQCRIMSNKPYPYALHRAHEIAVVTQLEKEQIMERIFKAMQNLNLNTGTQSHKLSAKQLPHRARIHL